MAYSFKPKFFLLLASLTFLVSIPLSSNQASTPPTRYRLTLQSRTRGELRANAGWLNHRGYDVTGVNLHRGTIDVLADEAEVKELRAKGLIGRVTALPVIAGRATQLSGLDDRYMNPDRVAKRLDALHAKFPALTRVIEIGRSLKDRPILAMVISTTPDIADPKFHEKPTVLFDGMHHAREIMTPEIVFDIGETLLGSALRARRARAVLENTNVVLVPMLNVDGNDRVWNNDNMWRKNAHAEGDSVFGVDINRNYPYRWAGCNGSSSSRGAQDYHGASAASEPETKALIGLASRIHPMASVSYHSYSELVLYPFGCNGDVTGENALLAKLGKEMAGMLPGDSGGHYTPGTPWQILYSVDGDSMGFMFAEFGAVAYTFEVNEEFQPSYDLREPTVKKHRVAWQYFLDQMQSRLLTVHVRDAAGNPVPANLDIAQIPHTKGERDFGTNVAGNYFKVLLPGKYVIRAKTGNGLTGSVDVVMGDSPLETTLVLK